MSQWKNLISRGMFKFTKKSLYTNSLTLIWIILLMVLREFGCPCRFHKTASFAKYSGEKNRAYSRNWRLYGLRVPRQQTFPNAIFCFFAYFFADLPVKVYYFGIHGFDYTVFCVFYQGED